eukprot:scaffold201724_cov32-Tisochrysis_lutea.AAC.4
MRNSSRNNSGRMPRRDGPPFAKARVNATSIASAHATASNRSASSRRMQYMQLLVDQTRSSLK